MSSRVKAITEAVRQFAFQRDQHHSWRRAASWLLLTNALTAAAFAGYVFFHSTVYITVAATPDGRLVPLTPLDEPIMSDAALRNWTVAAVTEAFTLGHHDWRLRLAGILQAVSLMLDWRRYRLDERRGAIDATGLALATERMRLLPGLANPAAGTN